MRTTAELARSFLRLQNTFDIDHFDVSRQNSLTALVAGSPKVTPMCVNDLAQRVSSTFTNVPPSSAIIDEFFLPLYSMDQRYAMLNALAYGARELAGLPHVGNAALSSRAQFPSRKLDSLRHNKYIAAADVSQNGQSGNRNISATIQDTRAQDLIVDLPRVKQLRLRCC